MLAALGKHVFFTSAKRKHMLTQSCEHGTRRHVPTSSLANALRPDGAVECSHGWSGAAALPPDAEHVESMAVKCSPR